MRADRLSSTHVRVGTLREDHVRVEAQLSRCLIEGSAPIAIGGGQSLSGQCGNGQVVELIREPLLFLIHLASHDSCIARTRHGTNGTRDELTRRRSAQPLESEARLPQKSDAAISKKPGSKCPNATQNAAPARNQQVFQNSPISEPAANWPVFAS